MSRDEIEKQLCACGGKCIKTCVDHERVLISMDSGNRFSILSNGRVVEEGLDHDTAVEHFEKLQERAITMI